MITSFLIFHIITLAIFFASFKSFSSYPKKEQQTKGKSAAVCMAISMILTVMSWGIIVITLSGERILGF